MLDPVSGREEEDGNPAARRNPHHPPVTSQRAHRGQPIAEEQQSNQSHQTWGPWDGGQTADGRLTLAVEKQRLNLTPDSN